MLLPYSRDELSNYSFIKKGGAKGWYRRGKDDYGRKISGMLKLEIVISDASNTFMFEHDIKCG